MWRLSGFLRMVNRKWHPVALKSYFPTECKAWAVESKQNPTAYADGWQISHVHSNHAYPNNLYSQDSAFANLPAVGNVRVEQSACALDTAFASSSGNHGHQGTRDFLEFGGSGKKCPRAGLSRVRRSSGGRSAGHGPGDGEK